MYRSRPDQKSIAVKGYRPTWAPNIAAYTVCEIAGPQQFLRGMLLKGGTLHPENLAIYMRRQPHAEAELCIEGIFKAEGLSLDLGQGSRNTSEQVAIAAEAFFTQTLGRLPDAE